MSLLLKASVSITAELRDWLFPFEKVDNHDWCSGDYVGAEVLPRSSLTEQFELPSGRTCRPLTGAGRGHDTLSCKDAGADFTFDFIDAGLPITVVSPEDYRAAIGPLLSRMADTDTKAAVIEAGASPLEPYNGAELVQMLWEHVAYTILGAWERRVDLVAGPTSNTLAGVALVHELAGLRVLNLTDDYTRDSFRQCLTQAVGAGGRK